MGTAIRAVPQTAPRRQQSPNSAMPSRLLDFLSSDAINLVGLEKTGVKVRVCLRVGKKACFQDPGSPVILYKTGKMLA